MQDRTADFDAAAAASDPSDVGSPEAVVRALYESISGPRSVERDWSRLRSLFEPGARLLIARWHADPERPRDVVYEWDVESFLAEGREMWLERGFWESELGSRVERFGGVAHVFSAYESRLGSEDADPVGRGVNSIQLIEHADRWWIVGIVWDIETPEARIPRELGG